MDTQLRKYVLVSYFFVAGLVAYITYELGLKLVGIFDLEARIPYDIDLVTRGASLLCAAIVFFVCVKHTKINQFTTETVVELSRVTWPTQKETTSATFIVMVMVLISGLFLGAVDIVWTKLLNFIL